MARNNSSFVGAAVNKSRMIEWITDYFIAQVTVMEVNFVKKAEARTVTARSKRQ